MTVYLIHYDHPIAGHAQHLLWQTDKPLSLELETSYHPGLGIHRAAIRYGIRWRIAGTWHNSKRDELRRHRNNRRLCPYCLHGRLQQHRLFSR